MKTKFFRNLFFFAILASYLPSEAAEIVEAAAVEQADHNAGTVWRSLRRGNREYINNRRFARQRARTANKQNPAACVIGCADSRVTPEFIFSQGIGDLFVCRTAGEVVDPVVIDSTEFTVRTHDTHLIIVMGHTNCGAVHGALTRLRNNGGVIDPLPPFGHLRAVLIPIEKAILAAGIDIYAPDAFQKSLIANVRYQADVLEGDSEVIRTKIANGTLAVMGVLYDLETGRVQRLFVDGKL